MPEPTNSYDSVPYDSHAYPQTHPGRIAAVATLFGLSPPPVETCRVLELGAAAGGNLIPMAEGLPGASFVGIDLSARQIEDGQDRIRRLGLTNIVLRHASITDLDPSVGPFDYIICHGVFSWVPAPVREKILSLCSELLTPTGIAYVSYNTYPGWHLRGMVRDMMRYHAIRFATPVERTDQARALLDFLAQSARSGGPYAAVLKAEVEAIKGQADSYLYHEHLEDVNQAFYFHEFAAMAADHRLRYLGEARVGTMVVGNLGPEAEAALKLLGTDQVRTEQFMDFIRNRTFRETLLVHDSIHLDWDIQPGRLESLHVSSSARAVSARPGAATQFRGKNGMSISTSNPVFQAVMVTLGKAWPGSVPFVELARQGGPMAGVSPGIEQSSDLEQGLLNAYLAADLIDLTAHPLDLPTTAGDRPVALASARLQAAAGAKSVANRRHQPVRLGDLERHLLPLLDGSRDRADLVRDLTGPATAWDFTVARKGQPVTDPHALATALAEVIEPALSSLATEALLIG